MSHPDPAQLRNVAVLGHRGSGKTSLVEAMLFAAGSTTRLGRVADGSTVCDFDEDEQRRGMSIAAALCHLEWTGVKVNLVDTPGEPSFQGDTLAALHAVDAALMVVNAAAGVEVQTERYWQRAAELGLPRAVVINMLDRERADFDAAVAGDRRPCARRRADPDPDRPRGGLSRGGQPGLDDRDDLRGRARDGHHRADTGRPRRGRPSPPAST